MTRCHDTFFRPRTLQWPRQVVDDVRVDAKHLGDDRKHLGETDQCRLTPNPTQVPLERHQPDFCINLGESRSNDIIGTSRADFDGK